MGAFMRILDGLEGLATRLYGTDRTMAMKMSVDAEIAKRENAQGHVWADYYFIAACYASAAGQEQTVRKAVTKVKEGFPNYDPSTRFRFRDVMPDAQGRPEEDTRGPWNEMRYRVLVIGQMNRFCQTHQDFSFAERMGPYFSGARHLTIRQDERQS